MIVEIGVVLLVFGAFLLLPGFFARSTAWEFGERAAAILRNAGFLRAAERWTRARGERVSRIAVVWFCLAGGCAVAGGVVVLVGLTA